jgi:hypothetical protein
LPLAPGIALVAIGLIIMLFLHTTIGLILLVVGVVGILAGVAMGAGTARREVIVERRRRPVREREVIRERRRLYEIQERESDSPSSARRGWSRARCISSSDFVMNLRLHSGHCSTSGMALLLV